MKTAWQEQILAYERELLEQVIPFWEKHCIDREFGGFFTCLGRDGQVYDTTKNMWMQWRIVYTFATMAATEYARPQWREIAENGYGFLTQYGHAPDGAYYFMLDRKGAGIVPPDGITEAYAAMAAAALFRLTGSVKYRQEAVDCGSRFIGRLRATAGQPGCLGLGPWRRHAPYMMMVCLGNIAVECLGEDLWSDDATAAADAIINDFYRPEFQAVVENIGWNGVLDLETSLGRVSMIGHSFETLWFVLHYGDLTGRNQWRDKACAAIRQTFANGWDDVYGGLRFCRDITGAPLAEKGIRGKVCWVHNEGVLATLYAFYLTGEDFFLDAYRRIDTWSWDHFRDPGHEEWLIEVDRRGDPADYAKGSLGKSMLHIPRCLLTGMDLMRKIAGGVRP